MNIRPTETNRSVLFSKIRVAVSQNSKRRINTLYGQNSGFLNVRADDTVSSSQGLRLSFDSVNSLLEEKLLGRVVCLYILLWILINTWISRKCVAMCKWISELFCSSDSGGSDFLSDVKILCSEYRCIKVSTNNALSSAALCTFWTRNTFGIGLIIFEQIYGELHRWFINITFSDNVSPRVAVYVL